MSFNVYAASLAGASPFCGLRGGQALKQRPIVQPVGASLRVLRKKQLIEGILKTGFPSL